MINLFNCIHYCLVCNKTEKCKNENCDFRNHFLCHGYCYAKLSFFNQVEYEKIIIKLKEFQKMEIIKND